MFENLIKYEVKIENESGLFLIRNGVSTAIAEQMILQFLQVITQIKIQQAQQSVSESADLPVSDEVKYESEEE